MRKVVLTTVILLSISILFGMGAFNLFNGRNHSELKWRTIETENFKIIYHDPLKQIATKAAAVCEGSYTALTKTYNIKPKGKIQIFLSDQDQISNGACVMNHYIFVWVNQNDFTSYFSGNEKWLRKVLAHELSHYFLFTGISSWLTPYFPMLANNFPTDINEGYAQFFSGERWGINRGDKYLRLAVESNNFELNSNLSFNGGLMYAKGFSFVRYVHAFYGEEKLIKLLKYRNNAKLFSLSGGFRKVFDKSYEDMYDEWRRYISTYYYGSAFSLKKNIKDDDSFDYTLNAVKKMKNGSSIDITEVVNKGKHFLIFGRTAKYKYYRELSLHSLNADSLKKNIAHWESAKKIIKTSYLFNISLSEDGNKVAYSAYKRYEHGSIFSTVFSYDRDTEEISEIARGNHVAISSEGVCYYHRLDRENNKIYYYDGNSEKTLIDLDYDVQVAKLELDNDEKLLAYYEFDCEGKHNVIVYDLQSNKKVLIKEFETLPIDLLWGKSNNLYVMLEDENDFHQTIHEYKFSSKEWNAYQAPMIMYSPISIRKEGDGLKVLTLVNSNRRSVEIGEMLINRKMAKIEKSKHYSKWITEKPNHEIKVPKKIKVEKEYGYNSLSNIKMRSMTIIPTGDLVVAGIFTEPLGKHILALSTSIPYSFKNKISYAAVYNNNVLEPSITVSALGAEIPAGIYDNKIYNKRFDKAAIDFSFPITLNKPFWKSSLGFSFAYSKAELEDDKFKGKVPFEDREDVAFSIHNEWDYNLPVINSVVHPVRWLNFSYEFKIGAKRGDFDKKFNCHSIVARFAYAPLYDFTGSYLFKMISFNIRSNFDKMEGDGFAQIQPGIDKYESVFWQGEPLFNRRSIRGYRETLTGEMLYHSQNELWFKLLDNLGFSAGFSFPAVKITYLGIAGWVDYAKIWNIDNNLPGKQNKAFESYGGEAKAKVMVMGIPTIHKFGRAYDMDNKKLDDYYSLGIELKFF